MSTFLGTIRYDQPMSDALTFGEWLLDELDNRGLKQRQFAEKLGVAPQTVSQWVTNTNPPTRRSCMLIARALGFPLVEVEERAGRRPLSRVDPVAEFQSLSENSAVYEAHYDLLEVQRQLQRAMDMLQDVLNQRGVIVTRVLPGDRQKEEQ